MAIIYRPTGRAGEYSEWATNIYRGCTHGCRYCYSPQVVRMKREEFHAAANLRMGYLDALKKSATSLAARGSVGASRVMLCFTCDPYPAGIDPLATRVAIDILHKHGMGVTILSKGGRRSVVDFDLLTARDAYATTLTCRGDLAEIWEPNAAPTSERIAALAHAKGLGLETWVSFEPVIYPAQTLTLMRLAAPLIDHCKIGPLNYKNRLPPELQALIPADIDWKEFARKAQELCKERGIEVYLKQDLLDLLRR